MKYKLIVLFLVIAIFVSGCGLLESPNNRTDNDKNIELGYIQWADIEAQTYLLKEILERLDYDVDATSLQAGPIFEGLANGDIDGYTGAWLPVTHADYWDNVKDDVVQLEPNFDGARIGLVVPEYVEIDSITELSENAEKFDKKIVGIEPGSGVMQYTQEGAIPNHGLEEWDLIDSSGPAMTAELASAIEDEEWVVVTGWLPHWKWYSFDLKFLDDPDNIYGEAETSYGVVREDLKEDMPEAYHLMNEFYLEEEAYGELIKMTTEGDTEEAAKEFVDNNLELINEWLTEDAIIE